MEPKLLHPNSNRRRADSSRAKLLKLDRRGECEKRERKLRERERERKECWKTTKIKEK